MVPKAAACGVLGLSGALAWAFSGRRPGVGSRVDPAAAAFLGTMLLSAFFSCDPRLSWFGRYPESLFAVSGLAACAAAFYLGCALRGLRREGPLLRWLCALSIPVCAYALAQAGGWDPWLRATGLPEGRAVSTWGSPVYLGAHLALLAPVSLWLWMRGERASDRWLGAAALAAGIPALAAAGSRGALLGAVVGLAAAWVIGRKAPAARASSWKLAAASAVVLTVLAALTWARRERTGSAMSDEARWGVWSIAAAGFRERPLLGWGPDTFETGFLRLRSEALARALGGYGPTQSHAHNDWLQMLACAGLAGLAAYLWLHIEAFRGARAALSAGSSYGGALAGGVLAVLVQAKFNSPSLPVAWLASLMAGALLGSPGRPRLAVPLFLAGAVLGACSTMRSALADRQARLGSQARRAGAPREAALRIERAIALAPEVTLYRYDLANLLWDASSAAQGPGRELILERAHEAAAEGVWARPMDAQAHRLLALTHLRRAREGAARKEDALPLALAAAKRALELDPNGGLTLETFIQAAREEGDAASASAVEERLARIVGGKAATSP